MKAARINRTKFMPLITFLLLEDRLQQ